MKNKLRENIISETKHIEKKTASGTKNKFLILFFIAIICFFSIGTLVKEDVEFSPNENRYLTTKPKFDIDKILNGEFEKNWESYLSDQVIGREFLVKAKSKIENSLGIKDINGTYIMDDGDFNKKRLVERITPEDFNWDRFKGNIKNVKKLIEDSNDSDVKVLICPSAFSVYKRWLPEETPFFNEKEAFDYAKKEFGADFIDMREAVESKSQQNLYYFTDHHWTNYGAYLGFREFMKKNNKDCPKYDTIKKISLTKHFKGTLYSKVLFTEDVRDEIETLKLADNKVKVEINGNTYDSILFKDRLKNKDKYEVFLGGNYDRVDIETAKKEGENILILKDSYANSFIPYLLSEYNKITMVDTRFYRGNIKELAEEYKNVLVLYSINNFGKEKIAIGNGLVN